MNIEFTERAARQIEREERWWREHRPDAGHLFSSELETALARIRTAPSSGQPYQRGRQWVRRIVLPQTRNHLYYRVLREDLVQVITLWGATRGRLPRF